MMEGDGGDFEALSLALKSKFTGQKRMAEALRHIEKWAQRCDGRDANCELCICSETDKDEGQGRGKRRSKGPK